MICSFLNFTNVFCRRILRDSYKTRLQTSVLFNAERISDYCNAACKVGISKTKAESRGWKWGSGGGAGFFVRDSGLSFYQVLVWGGALCDLTTKFGALTLTA